MTLSIGDKAPAFTSVDQNNASVSLADFAGKKLVLYFYPKDDTPGCTTEANTFKEHLQAFHDKGAVVVGVSKDTPDCHVKFIEKYGLPFTLLSDADGSMCEAYGTWAEKSMYGKKYMGIDRSTFLIDEAGKLIKIWRSVKVPGHVEEVLGSL